MLEHLKNSGPPGAIEAEKVLTLLDPGTIDILDIYMYIICVPTHNSNNEFILEFILREIKMADFECRQFEIGLEFVH